MDTDKETTHYVIPTNKEFIETVAKSIARERLMRESKYKLLKLGYLPDNVTGLESTVEEVFESVWSSESQIDYEQRDEYMSDARAAINAINLKLLLY